MEAFKISNLTFAYPESRANAINGVSIALAEGEFAALCGKSGSGKTTLLRMLKPVMTPHGTHKGKIFFRGSPLEELDTLEQAARIGFVQQNPDNQLVTDKVWHELAFGLESLGMKTEEIRLKVAEMASFFGIQTWFHKSVDQLSGGQKQLLNLASIMAMQPSVLILDEPTSQLDPIAAADFLATVGKINRELGTTVLITEHRLEEVLPFADRLIVMDEGRIVADGEPRAVGTELKEKGHAMFHAMPAPMQIYAGVSSEERCPVTVREGRMFLDQMKQKMEFLPVPEARPGGMSEEYPGIPAGAETVMQMKEVWFRYEKESPDVVKGLSLSIKKGEFYAVLGGNGTGKTTSLSILAGIFKPHRGKVKIGGIPIDKIEDNEKFNGLLGVLPQNPQALFVEKTVRRDLLEMLIGRGIPKEERQGKIARIVRLCMLEELLDMHPYDLSGGEQQRVALAKVLLLSPKILLLDEPTKGLDNDFKRRFAAILKRLQRDGVTILMVSHDIEFCARYADRCALFFDGSIVTENGPRAFFSGNSFYTTAANRMARHLLPEAVTVEDVIAALGGSVSDDLTLAALALDEQEQDETELNGQELDEAAGQGGARPDSAADFWGETARPVSALGKKLVTVQKPLPLWRKLLGSVILIASVALGLYLSGFFEGFGNVTSGDFAYGRISYETSWKYAMTVACLVSSIMIGLLLLFYKRTGVETPRLEQRPTRNNKLSKRTLTATVLILFVIPFTMWAGIHFFNDRKYYFISMLVILECLLPFVMIFEGRKPQARELLILAVLCAIAVAGRAAFFMLPQFKPVVAIVIIAGVAFGGEAGFVVGAVTAVVSNFFYGQGPWTPWQMFGFGIIGFLAGVLFQKGVLSRTKVPLCVFGGLTTFLIYGLVMNSAAVLMYQENPTISMFILHIILGIPFDMVHAIATVFFLAVAADPMLEKLDRIKLKYGLLEDPSEMLGVHPGIPPDGNATAQEASAG